MARNIHPVAPPILAADHTSVMALQSLADYQPANPAHSVAHLVQLQATLAQASQARQQAEIALEQARATEAETSHLYHDSFIGSHASVVAQYGPDSAAVELVGLTRRSNRKRTVRRKATA